MIPTAVFFACIFIQIWHSESYKFFNTAIPVYETTFFKERVCWGLGWKRIRVDRMMEVFSPKTLGIILWNTL